MCSDRLFQCMHLHIYDLSHFLILHLEDVRLLTRAVLPGVQASCANWVLWGRWWQQKCWCFHAAEVYTNLAEAHTLDTPVPSIRKTLLVVCVCVCVSHFVREPVTWVKIFWIICTLFFFCLFYYVFIHTSTNKKTSRLIVVFFVCA